MDNLVRAALHLGTRVIRLQQVVNRKVMCGKKHAQAQNRNKQHRVIQRIIGAAGRIEQHRQPRADNSGGKEIDLNNLPQADLKQPEYKTRLLLEGIGQKAVVAVHKQRLRKACTAVDCIHDEHKIRKICQ